MFVLGALPPPSASGPFPTECPTFEVMPLLEREPRPLPLRSERRCDDRVVAPKRPGESEVSTDGEPEQEEREMQPVTKVEEEEMLPV